ncbi:putative HOM6-homoserine dehydrogenase [Boletus reticuloceps]|uniref:Homoserine dehydrogenase n=1 Tax=Boletus reticuloceps TaxID=495285 RepID=A0A8I2YV98_9AGAM|nr:putative HOM6-homoserine dehydrogenase [Boletus reticuloceps]
MTPRPGSAADRDRILHLAIVGLGGVGSEIIQQIIDSDSPYPMSITAISNSRKMLLFTDGTSFLPKWRAGGLDDPNAQAASLDGLFDALSDVAQRKPGKVVLVDNTASQAVAEAYPRFMDAGIHIVTPNKKAFSGSLELYKHIIESPADRMTGRGVFYNEATVGAGLPIISTLKDLVHTGDKVKKIEGVFSGTLSYIFNEYSKGDQGGPSFSSIVHIARANGYTEPHPGDDLNGADVARKLTILSRMIPGLLDLLPNGHVDVRPTSLVPEPLRDADAPTFLQRLPEFDADMSAKRDEAAKRGNVLRYVGVIDVEQRTVEAKLDEYPKTHAFATSLQGSDNIIMFHTARYGARPLLIQGAGAGNAVTAMGVGSDILKLF